MLKSIRYSEILPTVLVCGPDGSGKTSLAVSLAEHLGMHYVTFHCQNLGGDTPGATEAKIKQTLNKVNKMAPIILILQKIEV